ncbi:hypothetical protein FB451DRAFT_561141 [Mycena latifolia]|nr:hypothetical protein FB451DRAFT_561141 [Mycena latifolia]
MLIRSGARLRPSLIMAWTPRLARAGVITDRCSGTMGACGAKTGSVRKILYQYGCSNHHAPAAPETPRRTAVPFTACLAHAEVTMREDDFFAPPRLFRTQPGMQA